MSSGVMPLGKIVCACEDVVEDPSSKKLHILGAFDAVRVPVGAVYPYLLRQLCVFAQCAHLRVADGIEVTFADLC